MPELESFRRPKNAQMIAELCASDMGGLIFAIILYRRSQWVLLVMINSATNKYWSHKRFDSHFREVGYGNMGNLTSGQSLESEAATESICQKESCGDDSLTSKCQHSSVWSANPQDIRLTKQLSLAESPLNTAPRTTEQDDRIVVARSRSYDSSCQTDSMVTDSSTGGEKTADILEEDEDTAAGISASQVQITLNDNILTVEMTDH